MMQSNLKIVTRKYSGQYTSVTDFMIKEYEKPNINIDFSISGHMDKVDIAPFVPPYPPNLLVGIGYDSGTTSEITIIGPDGVETNIQKGTILYTLKDNVPKCYTLSLSGYKIKGLPNGKYTLTALTGWIYTGKIYVDDRLTKTITISETIPPTPPPTPPSGTKQLTINIKTSWLISESDFLKEVGTTNPPPGTHYIKEGEIIKVEAIPKVFGTVFDKWIIDGKSTSKESTITLIMNTDHTVTAYFIPLQVMAVSVIVPLSLIYLIIPSKKEEQQIVYVPQYIPY